MSKKLKNKKIARGRGGVAAPGRLGRVWAAAPGFSRGGGAGKNPGPPHHFVRVTLIWVWVRPIGRTHTHISVTLTKWWGGPGFLPAPPPREKPGAAAQTRPNRPGAATPPRPRAIFLFFNFFDIFF